MCCKNPVIMSGGSFYFSRFRRDAKYCSDVFSGFSVTNDHKKGLNLAIFNTKHNLRSIA